MKSLIFSSLFFLSSTVAFAQNATVDVTLSPTGSFKAKSADVRGFVTKSGDTFKGSDIKVGLKNLQTGVSLRDTHTKKYLQVDKFPEAVLVSATGKDGKGTGVLKIKGIEKKITGTYKISGNTMNAVFPVKLSDFKIDNVKYMGVGVDDQVNIAISVPVKDAGTRVPANKGH